MNRSVEAFAMSREFSRMCHVPGDCTVKTLKIQTPIRDFMSIVENTAPDPGNSPREVCEFRSLKTTERKDPAS